MKEIGVDLKWTHCSFAASSRSFMSTARRGSTRSSPHRCPPDRNPGSWSPGNAMGCAAWTGPPRYLPNMVASHTWLTPSGTSSAVADRLLISATRRRSSATPKAGFFVSGSHVIDAQAVARGNKPVPARCRGNGGDPPDPALQRGLDWSSRLNDSPSVPRFIRQFQTPGSVPWAPGRRCRSTV